MQPIKINLPQNINAVLNSPEFDDEASIVIQSVKFSDKNAYLTFLIRFDIDKDMPQQIWGVSITGLEEEKIFQEWVQFGDGHDPVEIYSNHFLLLDHNDIATELYLKGTTQQPERLFIDIYNEVNILYDDVKEVSRYILPLR